PTPSAYPPQHFATPWSSPLSLPDALPISVGLAETGEQHLLHAGGLLHPAEIGAAGGAPACEVLGGVTEPGRKRPLPARPVGTAGDRKSTRLNSSHVKISYAVFCLKKKSRI